MPQLNLSLSTLGQLNNGTAEFVANAALAAAIADTADRGDDDKDRKVNLTVIFHKRKDGQIEIGFEAGVKMPAYKTADTVAEVRTSDRGKPVLIFRDDAAHDPKQRSFRDFPADPSEVPNQE